MRQPIQVLVYPVKVTKGDWEYLLLRRIASRGGFWQGVTGGVEDDEEILETARRELMEETGLVPSRLQRIDYTYAFPVEDKWRHLYAEGVKEVTEALSPADIHAILRSCLNERDKTLCLSLRSSTPRFSFPQSSHS